MRIIELNKKDAIDTKTGKVFPLIKSNGGTQILRINTKFREAYKEVDAYKIATRFGLPAASCEEVQVKIGEQTRKGVVIYSYLEPGETELSVADLLSGMDISHMVNMTPDEKIEYTVKLILNLVKGKLTTSSSADDTLTIKEWLYKMLLFDYIIHNDSREFSDMKIIMNKANNKFRLAPLSNHCYSFYRTDAIMDKKLIIAKEHSKIKGPFHSDPVQNLGDFNKYTAVLNDMMQKAFGRNNAIWQFDNIDILPGHKLIVNYKLALLPNHMMNAFSKRKGNPGR